MWEQSLRRLSICGLLLDAVETIYQRYVRVTTLVCRYQEALKLVEKINGEVTAGDSTARKRGLGITHFVIALLSQSEKHDAPLFIETTPVLTKDNVKEKRKATLLSFLTSCSGR